MTPQRQRRRRAQGDVPGGVIHLAAEVAALAVLLGICSLIAWLLVTVI